MDAVEREAAEEIDEYDPSVPFLKWGGGVLLPLVPFGLGMACIVRRVAFFPAGRGPQNTLIPFYGFDAVAIGISLLFAALWIHAHFFWPTEERLERHAYGVKLLSIFGLILSFGYVTFVLFRKLVDI